MSFRALVPAFLGRDWWDVYDYPERLMDQSFGLQVFDEDLLRPSLYRGFLVHPRTQANLAASGLSEVKNEKDKFQVSLDVKHFKPEELEVKIIDNYVIIHGKHEEKSDTDGTTNNYVSREFTRKYMLPSSCNGDQVTSSMTPEGMLCIVAPKKVEPEAPKAERDVAIKMDADSKK